MKKKTRPRHARKAARFSSRRRDYKTFVAREEFKDPLRGGKRPEDFQKVIPGEQIFSVIRGILQEGRNYLIDTCALKAPRRSLFKDYLELMNYAGERAYRPAADQMCQEMRECSDFWVELLTRKDVFILPEVAEETRRYQRILTSHAKKLRTRGLRRKLLEPVHNLVKGLESNSSGLADTGLLSDPVIPRIMEILSATSPGYRKPLSYTGQKIIGFAIAYGLSNGGTQVIITRDRAIREAMTNLNEGLTSGRRYIDLSDLCQSFEQFEVIHTVPLAFPPFISDYTLCIDGNNFLRDSPYQRNRNTLPATTSAAAG